MRRSNVFVPWLACLLALATGQTQAAGQARTPSRVFAALQQAKRNRLPETTTSAQVTEPPKTPVGMALIAANAPRVPGSSETAPAAGPAESEEDDPPEAETLTKGFWGLSDTLADYGIEVAVGSTNVYQTNVRNGLGTRQQSGRLTGSYDVEIAADFEKLLGLKGLGLFIHGEGGWPAPAGIDERMVGSVSGVNADALGSRPLDIIEVLLEWQVFDGLLTWKVGKMDFAGVFDASAYANDETAQFLNGALVNNLTIPLPEYCLGLVVTVALTDRWSVSAGVGDAEAIGTHSGFDTAFNGDGHYFYALETGLALELGSRERRLPGNYRVGLWYDPRPKAHSDSEEEYGNDLGAYASLDQMLLRESSDPEDSQGLGLFARYGWADEKRNDIRGFWSAGLQYQGLLGGRDEDVLGLGFARSVFSRRATETFPADHEDVVELYYNARVAPWADVSPHLQYLTNPGGNADVDDALVVGVRAQIDF